MRSKPRLPGWTQSVRAFERLRPALRDDLPCIEFIAIVRQMEGIAGTGLPAVRLRRAVLLRQHPGPGRHDAWWGASSSSWPRWSNRTLFFSLWWKALDDANAARLMQDAGDFTYWLEEMRHFKPYTLSEPEEKILNIKNVTGASAIERLYDSFTNRYTFKLEVDGETKEMTRGELMVYVRQSRPRPARARLPGALPRLRRRTAPILGQMYQTLVRDWRNENVNLRGYATPHRGAQPGQRHPRRGGGHRCWRWPQQNTGIFQRFFQPQGALAGDGTPAPLRHLRPGGPIRQDATTYDRAAGMVLASFSQFDPQFGALAQRVFDEGHLDSEVRKGKRGGAFCWSVEPAPDALGAAQLPGPRRRRGDHGPRAGPRHPRHAGLRPQHLHLPFLAAPGRNRLHLRRDDAGGPPAGRGEATRPCAATSSSARWTTPTPPSSARPSLPSSRSRPTRWSSRTPRWTRWPRPTWRTCNDQFGDAVEVADEFRWEWVSIPHIYATPVLCLRLRLRAAAGAFALPPVPARKARPSSRATSKILATGGSQAPAKLLAEAGIDIRQASFWQGGFDVIGGLVSELEKIPVKK